MTSRKQLDRGTCKSSARRSTVCKQSQRTDSYKLWIDNAPSGAVSLHDNAVRRAHKVLAPIIDAHGTPRGFNPNQRRQTQINEKPLAFLSLFLAVLTALATDETLQSARPRLAIPVRRSFIPKHIRLDAGALSKLGSETKYDPSHPKPNQTEKNRAQERRAVFGLFFYLIGRPFQSGKWTLSSSIETDGYALSVLKRRRGSAPKTKAERGGSTRGAASARRREGGSAFPDLEQMSDEEVLGTRGRSVFVDSGKHNIAFALSDWTTLGLRRSFGTLPQRGASRLEQRSSSLQHRRLQLERNLPPELKGALQDFRQSKLPSSRVFSAMGIARWLQILDEHFRDMTKIYGHSLYRTQRMSVYS
ncbi:hypothetical protein A4X09_0g7690 [Tilletia walkeri]|uniref:Uncharacterized protein n=1 Tax=Tilletia walkeri TaxID=117179 RepID=A0A8X7N1H4_9BASI|nr:hypothetical protein A4X09_0g7690 [Tilletia walkeri]